MLSPWKKTYDQPRQLYTTAWLSWNQTLNIEGLRDSVLNSCLPMCFIYCSKCFQFSSVTLSCLALCSPIDCSTPGLPVHHQHPEFTQTRVHSISDAIQPSHPLLSSSPPAFNLLPASGSFQMSQFFVSGGQNLEFHLQYQSFQWIFRTDFL